MAQPFSARWIRPLARRVADHATADPRLPFGTGHLPRPRGGGPRQAGRRRLADQRCSLTTRRGRWNPYARRTAPGARPVLALMACVVVAAVGGLLLTPLGLPPLLAPRGLAARPRPVAVPPAAPAAARDRLVAAPAR